MKQRTKSFRSKLILISYLTLTSISSLAIELPPLSGLDLIGGKIIEIKSDWKNLVVFFLNRSCPCSQAHFDHLNSLAKKYPQFSFVGFHSNKKASDEEARKYFRQFKVNFPIIQDKTLKFANSFNALKTPHTFVLNNENKLIYQGGATSSRDPARAKEFYLAKALSQLSNNQKITNPITKILGCYIQR